ncbi:MAG: (d)CMP kinase [Peptococcaceae bacterium]|nr:(d)CMP kinase [Peptococcaceae bacterium]
MNRINVAIDGPAGAGKSTVAKQLAQQLNLRYLDTGAMYRALTSLALELQIDLENEAALTVLAETLEFGLDEASRLTLGGQAISEEVRTPRVSQFVSLVSSYPLVRHVIVAKQRTIALAGGIVMDGRDIGTTVMIDAPVKIFLIADLDERAKRRQLELRALGHMTELADLTQQMQQRDYLDSTRATSPLRPADDAVIIDTTELLPHEVIDKILEIVRSKVDDAHNAKL